MGVEDAIKYFNDDSGIDLGIVDGTKIRIE